MVGTRRTRLWGPVALVAAGALVAVAALGGCRSVTPGPVPTSAGPTHSRPSPSKPPKVIQIHAYLDLDHFPTLNAHGGPDAKALRARLTAQLTTVLNSPDGWDQAGFHFDLAGPPPPDNHQLVLVILSQADVNDPRVTIDDPRLTTVACPKPAARNQVSGGCYWGGDGTFEPCVIVLNFTAATLPANKAGIILHEDGHCLLGPNHSTKPGDLMFGFLGSGPDGQSGAAKTARPSAAEIAAVKARLAGVGATPFIGRISGS